MERAILLSSSRFFFCFAICECVLSRARFFFHFFREGNFVRPYAGLVSPRSRTTDPTENCLKRNAHPLCFIYLGEQTELLERSLFVGQFGQRTQRFDHGVLVTETKVVNTHSDKRSVGHLVQYRRHSFPYEKVLVFSQSYGALKQTF